MRMDGQDESSNVEDVRGMGGGGGGGFGIGGRGLGIGSIAIAVIAGWIFGINPLALLGMMERRRRPDRPAAGSGTEAAGRRRRRALRLAGAAQHRGRLDRRLQGVGPDLPAAEAGALQRQLADGVRPGPGGDGPVLLPQRPEGLHRPALLQGARAEARRAGPVRAGLRHRPRGRPPRPEPARHHGQGRGVARPRRQAQANALSVRVELQADCFAGVWAARSQKEQGWRLEPGDIEAALNAAAQIGDDTLQRKSQGTVVPESFTHGTSAQRVNWFKRGVESGSVDRCNTFEGRGDV